MSLLKLAWTLPSVSTLKLFTFHYVTIKTENGFTLAGYTFAFTFHYVTIKTKYILCHLLVALLFTFHYVTIKTLQGK